MFKTILKAVAVLAAADIVYDIGKGVMLACVKNLDPETGVTVREDLKGLLHDDTETIGRKVGCAVTLKTEELVTRTYFRKK